MKYRVEVGYIDITFTDRIDAIDFAEQAKLHADEDIKVTIELIKEESDV